MSALSDPNMNEVVGQDDLVLITLDTLRYDAAQRCFEEGRLPVLSRFLPAEGWEKRHTPASFTYAAHAAFFAGFLPTPAAPGPHSRLFALAFEGSQSTAQQTFVFQGSDNIVQGLAQTGYRTICIGGVGFFNKRNPLGSTLPGLFDESYWSPRYGVAEPRSTENQVSFACSRLSEADLNKQRCFLFINVAALHQPNRCYLPSSSGDDFESHCAALSYVDGALKPLFDCLRKRNRSFVIVCSDHGTAYGEDGYYGHRLAHEVVMTVPYTHFRLNHD